MCCLRYEHEFYVQQRKRFPKEGKIVTTSKGQEKVIVNDIFRERITLRAEDGETRLLSLLELRQEMGTERVSEPTGEGEAFVSAVEDVPEEVIRLQDTVELPAWVPRSPETPKPNASRQLPVTEARPAAAALPVESPPEASVEAAEDAGDDDAEATSAPATAEGDAPPERRRRRRGRRGGRRNRGPDRQSGGGELPDSPDRNPGGES
jgi:hypothetical protein